MKVMKETVEQVYVLGYAVAAEEQSNKHMMSDDHIG